MTPASGQGRRRSGILLHFTSLPSRYGIGDMGPVAFQWIDRLRDAGQAWWQVLPLAWTNHTVAYPGTHDNNTTRGWFEALPGRGKQLVRKYVGWSAEGSHGIAAALMRSAWPSAAGLTIAPLQDVLDLGTEARINVRGRAQGNWRWRWADSAPSEQAFRWLAELTSTSGRARDQMPPAVPAIAQRNPEPILLAV
jgi:4-alpha-glucanotransferase